MSAIAPPSLSPEQASVRDHFAQVRSNAGRSPTYAEAGKALGISAARVHQHIVKLESLGVVRRTCGTWRGVKVI